jgi:photosystem II stability/assembly factor-like uncharacterized protein
LDGIELPMWCLAEFKSFRPVVLRCLLASALSVCLSFPPALAKTGVRALDEPAIAVRDPSGVPLISVARAGNRLVAVGVHGVIIISDDNGASWQQAAVPVNVALTAVSFATPRIGWAVGHYGVILRTTDGGLNWSLQLNGLQANQLTLAAAQAAVAANDPAPGTPLAMKRANFFVAAGADKPFLTIWTPNADEAIALGAYRLAMKTTDGGKTWSDWDLHVGDPLSHNLYDIVPIGADLYIAAETGLVFHSADGGDSFAQVTPPVEATMFGALATGDGGLLVYGVAGQAFTTKDAGHSWQNIPGFDTNANLIAATTLADGAIVLGGENGILYASHDHGQSFKPLPETEPMAIYDIVQAANGDLVVVGNAGVLLVPAKDFNPA